MSTTAVLADPADAPVRGRLTPNAPLAPLTWFKTGGAAEWLFEPADADDLAGFLAALDSSGAGDGAWAWVQPDRARRRRAGGGSAAGQAVRLCAPAG